MSHSPVLLVHGGAWAIPDELLPAHLNGVKNALAAGWKVLDEGGSSLDAIEEAIVVLEDDDTFDAGRGSFLNRDGRVELDALMMDGATLRAGGVGCVEHVRNPVRLCRKILDESPHVYLVARGAEQFAQQHGIELIQNEELVVPREVEHLKVCQDKEAKGGTHEVFAPTSSHDTVGAIALDVNGNVAAATSTGGTLNKTPGRVGDSSLIGCGCYADNHGAACSTTGWGEPMMKLVLAKWANDRVLNGGEPSSVAHDAIEYLHRRLNGHGGMILLDTRGRYGIAHNTPRMAWALRTKDGELAGTEKK